MGFFDSIGKGLKKFGSWTGKNLKKVGGVALPLAGMVAGLAIPGVGGAVGNVINKVSGSIFGTGGESSPTEGVNPALLGSVAQKPDGSGGLFGKGGLFGTGLLASREWTQYNKSLKWAKRDSKVLEEAAKITGIKASSIEDLERFLAREEIDMLEMKAHNLLVSQGQTPPAPPVPGKPGANSEKDNSTLLKIGGAALAAKLLGWF